MSRNLHYRPTCTVAEITLIRSGRWRSTYTLSSPTASEVDSHINVQIHYFEEGNVQLNSNKSDQVSISNQSSSEEATAKAIVKAIEGFEAKYQEELFNTCNELSEGAFRSLRRQLPMTKQKMDWDRVNLPSIILFVAVKSSSSDPCTYFHRFSITTLDPNWASRQTAQNMVNGNGLSVITFLNCRRSKLFKEKRLQRASSVQQRHKGCKRFERP